MPPKAAVPAATEPAATTTSGPSGTQGDTSMAETSQQSVEWYRDMITQLAENQAALKEQLDKQGHRSVKMPSVERFSGEAHKLRGFLTQVKIKIVNEGPGLPTVMEQVAYAGLYLSGRALEWFEPYLTEIQANGMSTTNQEARFMFSTWEGFCKRLTQMFGSPEEESLAEEKLETIRQTSSASAYSTEFQMWATRTSWNKEALMAKYRRGLKSKVQDALILMEDAEDMRTLIDQAIRIDNRIFQREKASKIGSNRVTPVHRAPQPVQKPWYGAEPMDLSATRESRRKHQGKPRNQGFLGQQNQQHREQRPNQGSQEKKTFERTPQQQQWFKDGACMKCGKKGHFARDCKGGQQNHAAKGTNTAWNNDHVKATRECSIRHFAFCYNSACRVHEDAKYGAGWWPQEPESSHAKATQELDDEQDRIHYGMDMHGSTMSPEPVMHSIEEVDEDASDEEMSQWEEDELSYASEAEIDTATDSMTIAGTETPLDTVSIASRDERESIHSESSGQDASTIPSLDKGKKPQAQDSEEQMRDDFTLAMQVATLELEEQLTKSRGQAAMRDVQERLSNMRQVLVGKPPETTEVRGSSSWTRTRIGKESEQSAPPIYQKIQLTKDESDTTEKDRIKSHVLKDPQRRMPKEDWTAFSKRIAEWQAKRGYPKFPNEPQQQKHRTSPKKSTHRPRAGTPRAKWLEELESEEELGAVTRFAERNIGKCYETAAGRYFLKDHPMSITQVYQKWYRTRLCDDWEDFDVWLDNNITPELPFTDSHTKHIKGALVMTTQDLEERSQHWREQWDFAVPAKDTPMESSRYPGGSYSKQDEDEPRDDPKHPAHHTLSWIACVDDHCRMHQYPKQQASRYPQRMYWPPAAAKHRNAKYMHGWRALEY